MKNHCIGKRKIFSESEDIMADKRILNFSSYSDIKKEIESLHKGGYKQGGKWNLGQICRHLSYYYKGALDGFSSKMPWIIQVTIGKMVKKSLLKQTSYRQGMQTDPKSVYNQEPDEKAAVQEILGLLDRLEKNASPLHPSGFFGEMTNDEWKTMNLGHAAHHLGFLYPNS